MALPLKKLYVDSKYKVEKVMIIATSQSGYMKI